MAVSVKISQLIDGGSVNSADYLPVARGSADTLKIPASQFVVGAQNIGGGSATIFKTSIDGSGRTLQFRSLSGVDGVSVVNVQDTLVISASGQNPVKTSITGNGVTTTYAINGASSINANNYRVDIDGVLQEPLNDYTISGSNIVFTSAPPNGSKVTVVSNNLVRVYDIVPSDGSVTNIKVVNNADISPSKLAGKGYIYVQTLYYSTTGTSNFIKENYPWLRGINVKVQGAGGSGGGSNSNANQYSAGGGGGAGAYAESFITDISSLPSLITITVGAGGGGVDGTNGQSGGSSSFSSLVVANGGTGGNIMGSSAATANITNSGGTGGTTTTGQFSVPGQSGSHALGIWVGGSVLAQGYAGSGGNSYLGKGGRGALIDTSAYSKGDDAIGYGAGGGGGATVDTALRIRKGGNGGNGIVIVELYA